MTTLDRSSRYRTCTWLCMFLLVASIFSAAFTAGLLRLDHAFLLAGDVFSKDQIEAYSELKWEEIYAFEQAPHPIEFQMYYSS